MLQIEVKYKDRIDKYVTNNSDISRNDIKQLILEGAVLVNNVKINKPKFEVHEGQIINIIKIIDKTIHINPEKMDLNIVYDDEYICVIDKPSGMVVHPSPGHHQNTLVNGLLYHFKNNLSNENGLLRPGIVHRIDKDTSGLLIIAKNNEVHKLLSDKFSTHSIKREYIAICDGILEDKRLKLNLPIGRSNKDRQKMAITNTNSKNAITNVTLLNSFYLNNQPKSLVKCELETGRTHQIRVHMQYIGNPIYGDPVYGKSIDEFGQRLHAYSIEFQHPVTHKKMLFFSDLPEIMKQESNFNFSEFIKNERGDNDQSF
ncbi:RluA family pseudouridine synthase [Mycoplasma leonicaptivi]|uniref:RluA family pseudouridine synthase n=1 Tax=Mycoplasma leonicaptivi TaxID=36742 RepID=UPI000484429B|nr:RluA family pseudouridine synthase [Mycoplasma leonicaptivi]